MDAELSKIAERLAGVERSLRRSRIYFYSLALVVVCAGAAEAVKDATFGTVKATMFELVDSKGKTLGGLAVMSEDGEEYSGLVIRDASGNKATIATPGSTIKLIDKTKN